MGTSLARIIKAQVSSAYSRVNASLLIQIHRNENASRGYSLFLQKPLHSRVLLPNLTRTASASLFLLSSTTSQGEPSRNCSALPNPSRQFLPDRSCSRTWAEPS